PQLATPSSTNPFLFSTPFTSAAFRTPRMMDSPVGIDSEMDDSPAPANDSIMETDTPEVTPTATPAAALVKTETKQSPLASLFSSFRGSPSKRTGRGQLFKATKFN